METKPCPEGNKYCIVLDNAPWHKKAIRLIWTEQLEEYADIREKMDYLSLPPYSPDLNPIEQVWRKTRREKTHNRFFSAISKLINVLDDITLRSFLCQTINSSRYAVSVALRSNTQVLNSFTISLIRNVAAGHGTFSLPVHSLARTGLFGCLFGLRVFSISGTTCPVISSSQHRWYSSRRNSGQLW